MAQCLLMLCSFDIITFALCVSLCHAFQPLCGLVAGAPTSREGRGLRLSGAPARRLPLAGPLPLLLPSAVCHWDSLSIQKRDGAAWPPSFAVRRSGKLDRAPFLELDMLGFPIPGVLTQCPFSSPGNALLWLPLALFPGPVFMRMSREKQIYTILSDFEVVCTSPLICKTSIVRKRALRGHRNYTLPACCSVLNHCSDCLLCALSPHSHVPPCP